MRGVDAMIVWEKEILLDDVTERDNEGFEYYAGPVDVRCQMASECCTEGGALIFLSTGDANESSRYHYTWVVVLDDGRALSVCEDCAGRDDHLRVDHLRRMGDH